MGGEPISISHGDRDALQCESATSALNFATVHFGRFSNRPVGVKHFQTIHPYSVDVAHGLVLLFGIGTRALPSWDFEDEVERS